MSIFGDLKLLIDENNSKEIIQIKNKYLINDLLDRVAIVHNIVFLDGVIFTSKYFGIEAEILKEAIIKKYKLGSELSVKIFNLTREGNFIYYSPIGRLNDHKEFCMSVNVFLKYKKRFYDREDLVTWYDFIFNTQNDRWVYGICRFCNMCEKENRDFQVYYKKCNNLKPKEHNTWGVKYGLLKPKNI